MRKGRKFFTRNGELQQSITADVCTGSCRRENRNWFELFSECCENQLHQVSGSSRTRRPLDASVSK